MVDSTLITIILSGYITGYRILRPKKTGGNPLHSDVCLDDEQVWLLGQDQIVHNLKRFATVGV